MSKLLTAELLTIDTFPSGKQQASVFEMNINTTVYLYFSSKCDSHFVSSQVKLRCMYTILRLAKCTALQRSVKECFSFLCCFGD